MKKNPPYFIVGLPRSRTAWLANLFTYNDSFCVHEISRYTVSLDGIPEKFEQIPYPSVGTADSGLLLEPEKLLHMFPHSKFAVIIRDSSEARASYLKAFPEFRADTVELMFQKCEEGLLKIIKGAKKVHTAGYAHLNNEDMLESLWDFLADGTCFNRPRCQMLQQMRVDTVFSKMEAALHPAKREALSLIRKNQQFQS